MAAERPRPPVAAAAVAVAALLAGCSTPETASGPTSAGPGAPSRSAQASSASGPAPAPATSSASATPFDRTATPATTSGTLGPRSMPAARVLGPRWTSRVDPGSAEDGYTGNGTSVVARDPQDVVDALLPLGCASDAVYATPLPVPRHALEADYVHQPTGAHAVGLVLDFGAEAAADRFVAVYTSALRRCTAGAGGTMAVAVERAPRAGMFASRQVDRAAGETWRELVAPAGRVVRLIAVEGASTPLRPWSAIAADLPPAT